MTFSHIRLSDSWVVSGLSSFEERGDGTLAVWLPASSQAIVLGGEAAELARAWLTGAQEPLVNAGGVLDLPAGLRALREASEALGPLPEQRVVESLVGNNRVDLGLADLTGVTQGSTIPTIDWNKVNRIVRGS